MVEKEEAGGGISEEEAAQYDRQIRLWGLEAQKRLRASRVLLVGMKGLGAEIAKNLILAGVKGLTMLDPEQVSPEDPGAQFLIRTGSVGRNRAEASLERAQNLNPMVDVKVDTENIEKKPESFFTQFDAVCLTCCSRDVIVKVDQICHKNSIKFFTGDVFGYHGYTFANLGEHEFVEEKTKVAKASQGVEDGPDTKRAKLDSSETTMVKKALSQTFKYHQSVHLGLNAVPSPHGDKRKHACRTDVVCGPIWASSIWSSMRTTVLEQRPSLLHKINLGGIVR
ncbi:SUMO-activating enzyme subunit 1 isoform X4 [Felis catus]|uniref:SUMO-activating enzyme subunit 1 n=1 Tax=Felis catus TaxID=9685 RepID=A0ABI8AED5_FELCA|nr:SUMO-activating enzyme subunit 1 isoform X4 [Felis catus]